MSLLLHAITSPPEGPAPRGFGGRDLLAREVDGLTVWATPLPDEHVEFTRDDVLEAHRVVTDIFAVVSACLPVRFPTQVEDLAVEVEALMPDLERVRDACELGVTAAWSPPLQESTPPVTPPVTPTTDSPGRRYLEQRQIAVHRRDRAEQLTDDLLTLLGASVLAEKRAVCPSEKIALSLALLVPRAEAETLKARIPRSAQDVRILINGPWPPYTFAARLEHTHGRGTGGAQA